MLRILGFGLTGIIPAGVLLTLSFYVLAANEKVETKSIKTFGRVVVVVLWILTVLAASMGIYGIIAGRSRIARQTQRKEMMQESTGNPLRDQMRQEMRQEMMKK